jgi:hypothetical protein
VEHRSIRLQRYSGRCGSANLAHAGHRQARFFAASGIRASASFRIVRFRHQQGSLLFAATAQVLGAPQAGQSVGSGKTSAFIGRAYRAESRVAVQFTKSRSFAVVSDNRELNLLRSRAISNYLRLFIDSRALLCEACGRGIAPELRRSEALLRPCRVKFVSLNCPTYLQERVLRAALAVLSASTADCVSKSDRPVR